MHDFKIKMPFKIVQTYEDGEQCLSIVPSGWEIDGILWWPSTTSAAKLIQNEHSLPTSKWKRMQCVKKREYRTKLEADAELAIMETNTDTEAEERMNAVPSSYSKKQRKEITSNSSARKHVPKNFNEFLPTGPNLLHVAPLQIVQEKVQNTTVNLEQIDEGFHGVVYVDSAENTCDSEVVIQSIDIENITPVSLDDIADNQAVIIDNQMKIITTLAQVKTSLDYLNTKVVELGSGFNDNVSTVSSNDFFKPVDSQEMLDALEKSLMDDAVYPDTSKA